MPWKETSVLEGRMEMIVRIKQGESVSAVTRDLGVSRMTAHIHTLVNPSPLISFGGLLAEALR